jgi:hypothetical protein
MESEAMEKLRLTLRRVPSFGDGRSASIATAIAELIDARIAASGGAGECVDCEEYAETHGTLAGTLECALGHDTPMPTTLVGQLHELVERYNNVNAKRNEQARDLDTLRAKLAEAEQARDRWRGDAMTHPALVSQMRERAEAAEAQLARYAGLDLYAVRELAMMAKHAAPADSTGYRMARGILAVLDAQPEQPSAQAHVERWGGVLSRLAEHEAAERAEQPSDGRSEGELLPVGTRVRVDAVPDVWLPAIESGRIKGVYPHLRATPYRVRNDATGMIYTCPAHAVHALAGTGEA